MVGVSTSTAQTLGAIVVDGLARRASYGVYVVGDRCVVNKVVRSYVDGITVADRELLNRALACSVSSGDASGGDLFSILSVRVEDRRRALGFLPSEVTA
jgi:hypothetical protein